jgi:serine/threonine-protein kinase HipA
VPDELAVLLGGRRAGTLTQGVAGALSFAYDDGYRRSEAAVPISLSMPLTDRDHTGPAVRAFCQGLLPDNEDVLERWGRDFQVSARNPFALLRHVGEDCAGAVQFTDPERVAALLEHRGSVQLLTTAQVAARLRTLRRDPAAWHLASSGQFSLAGAQAKTALFWNPGERKWGDPSGAVPTTHIIKPAIAGFDDHDLNEHLCLIAAGRAGLVTAASWVETFDAERAIVVERYDRLPAGSGAVVRVHQEDMCQALGVAPSAKYQNEGGPSAEQIISLLRSAITPSAVAELEVRRFVDALALNWLIAGTDAHAKNYSVLLTPTQIRLAPLYDIASSLPYDDMHPRQLKLAMKIGDEYRITAIGRRHWDRFAELNGLDAESLRTRIGELADRLPAALQEAAGQIGDLRTELPGRLVERVGEHVASCRLALAG